MTDGKKDDMTINVKNEEIEKCIDTYLREKTAQSLNRLVTMLRTSRILVPANLNKDKKPAPCLIQGPDNTKFFPLFTSKEQIPPKPKSEVIMNLPFLKANEMVEQHIDQINGIAINPFTQNLIFKRRMIEQIAETEKKLKEKPQIKTVEMTLEDYIKFERREFEFGHLPKQFFTQGKKMLEELCEKRETYIDELFEAGYQQPRMYPHLTEEFSVMVMNLSEELLLVRVDLPENGMGIPSCCRIYLSWDDRTGRGRYFTVEKTKEEEKWLIGEIDAGFKHINHADIPAGGAEMQKIVELLEMK